MIWRSLAWLHAMLLLLACVERGVDGIIATDNSTGTSPGTEPATVTTEVTVSSTTSADAMDVTSSAPTTTDDDEGSVLISPGDHPGHDTCDPLFDDCPAGEKCAHSYPPGSHYGMWTCAPIDRDPGQLGDPCTVAEEGLGFDDCDKGLMCWGVGADNLGRCEDMCLSVDPGVRHCNDPDEVCVFTAAATVFVCVPPCHPVAQDCAALGDGCIFGGLAGWVCAPAGDPNATSGVECEGKFDCAAGFECLKICGAWADDRCCIPYCDPDDPQSAKLCASFDPPLQCQPWDGGNAEDFDNIGSCWW